MDSKRCEHTYILRIWREPSDLAPPGEWRGTLRSPDGRREWHFRSAQELWAFLIAEAPPPPAGQAHLTEDNDTKML
jgi:hypothetical protein